MAYSEASATFRTAFTRLTKSHSQMKKSSALLKESNAKDGVTGRDSKTKDNHTKESILLKEASQTIRSIQHTRPLKPP